jgi:hypothetical protein
MINDLPTVYEVVSGGPRQIKDRSSVDSGSKSKITKVEIKTEKFLSSMDFLFVV